MPPPTIWSFTPADTSAGATLGAGAGRGASGPGADRAAFTAATQDEDLLVAERDGIVRGFAAVHTGDAPEYFLHHLYVHPAHSGRGIGTQLLAAVVARFGPHLSLKTQLANTGARRFYARAGWIEGAADSGVDLLGAWLRVRYRAGPGK
jgi:GNAT superfamily N-acetyltransferase